MAVINPAPLDWSSEFLSLFLTLRQLYMPADEHELYFDWTYGWTGLATSIHDLLDPGSFLAASHPRLHEVLTRRYSASMASRPGQEVSKCSHLAGGVNRTDSLEYQYQIHLQPQSVIEYGGQMEAAATYHANLCSTLLTDFMVRGIIGIGTFGVVFLAHKRGYPVPHGPISNQLYAIKVEPLFTINTCVNPLLDGSARSPHVAPLYDAQLETLRYLPIEALVLLLVDGCDKFPSLDSVYSHQFFSATVMEAQVDQEAQNRPYHENASVWDWLRPENRFHAFNGAKLLNRKKTSLAEIQACKVSSHLFEATAYLQDMRLCNTDISHNNYLVDEQLNAKMIDLGLLHFGLRDADFWQETATYIPFYEKFMTPELALESTKSHWARESVHSPGWPTRVDLPHDVRRLTRWQLAAITYELLHGFVPWEEKEWDERIGGIVNYLDGAEPFLRMRKVQERRSRIINKDLPIDENLSQDCVDALRMMFVKDPQQRPTLEEMASFTWFGQWSYHSAEEFRRPSDR
ncbi:Protein kinase domain-containing protein [Aspergillus ibericus CBS 121593]|uniref:non-specific serine/threonine protein kinase n=1 Tax=Aspergillus ibericus CBS 121593 TaxID=1448316 RepID=A0A395GJL6_9EURO|nr:kinase-like protein [Aspergillus ibericus CBS 121593]RAK95238.1 kinase-like protein [Aspergillus ibericus CBS 121593]